MPNEDGSERPRIRLEGEIPSHADPPSGCVFHTRCPRYIGDVCREKEPQLKEVEPGHFWRCHYSVEELRELQQTAPGEPGRSDAEDPRRGARARGRAARAGRARAGGPRARARCSSGCTPAASATRTSTRSTGPRETRCPAVLGHEGAGVVEAVGDGVGARARDARRARPGCPPAGAARSACASCRTCARPRGPAMEHGGLLDGTPRLSRDGEPVFHYSLPVDVRRARASCRRPAACRSPTTCRSTIAALVGCAVATGTGAVWRTAGVRPGERVAVFGCGGVGHERACSARSRPARRRSSPSTSPGRSSTPRSRSARPHAVLLGRAAPRRRPSAVRAASGGGVDYAIEATGRPEAARAAFLSTRARGAAVLIGIPRADAVVELPALTIPRMERRVLGSIYGSSRPGARLPGAARAVPARAAAARPADLARLPLDAVEEGFALMRDGARARVVTRPGGGG